jgi:hypothetical protein
MLNIEATLKSLDDHEHGVAAVEWRCFRTGVYFRLHTPSLAGYFVCIQLA